MARVYVGIGSNIEREANIRGAVQTLCQHFGPLTLSQVYESRPIGFEGTDFYNLVAGFETSLPIEQLLGELHGIEKKHGRKRTGRRFEARTLDLDLLLYNAVVRHDGEIDVPRAEILEYAFMLRPLAEIAPTLTHPENGKSFSELWNEFGDNEQKLHWVEFTLPD